MRGFTKFRKLLVIGLVVVLIVSLFGISTFAVAAGTMEKAPDPNAVTAAGGKTEANVNTTGYDVTKAGADGSDTKDDTAAIQNALNEYDSVYIPDGIYYINVNESLKLNSNQTLTMGSGALLTALPTDCCNYSVIDISGISGVTVTGGQIIGERAIHQGTDGEWGMGILIENGAKNITVSGVTVSNCWGDGIYLGGTPAVSDIRIDGVTCDNNRRQGMSITNATQVTVTNSVFQKTHGTAPEAGIDIEPNDGETTQYITISNTQVVGNAGSGLLISGWCESIADVTVAGCTMSGNADAGLDISGWNARIAGVAVTDSTLNDNQGAGLRINNAEQLNFANTVISNNETGIDILRDIADARFTGMTVSGNMLRGVSLATTGQTTGTFNIVFESMVFANNSQRLANDQDGIRIDNYDSTGTIQGVTFRNCRFDDNQSNKTQRYGLTVGYSSGMSGIIVESNCTFNGNVTGSFLGPDALSVQ